MNINLPEPGELDNVEGVNLADFAVLSSHWQDTNCGTSGWADLTGDGNVGLDDLTGFLADWLEDNNI